MPHRYLHRAPSGIFHLPVASPATPGHDPHSQLPV